MPHFSVDEFKADPKTHLPSIVNAQKSELWSLVSYFQLEVPSRAKKAEIRNAIIEHCIEEDIVTDEEGRAFLVDLNPESSEIAKMKLALQLEQAKAQAREREAEIRQKEAEIRQKEAEIRQKEADAELEKQAKEIELKQRYLEVELECKRKSDQADLEKFQKELELKGACDLELEERKSKLAIDQKKLELALEDKRPVKFDLNKCTKLVPKFDEKEVDMFFRNFEDIASHMKWPLEHWVWLIKTQLVGKAASVIGSLTGEMNYGVIKKAILDAYAITSEGYRQKFRNYLKPPAHTWTEFLREKVRLFTKWLESENVSTFDQLVNLMVFEEFKRRLPHNIMLFLSDKEEKDGKKAATLADTYTLVHRVHGKEGKKIVKQNRTVGNGDKDETADKNFCVYCKQTGHVIADCPSPTCKKNRKEEKKGSKVTLHCATRDDSLFENFISDGVLTLPNHDNEVKVKILRDTGSSQSMVLRSVIPKVQCLDENVIVTDLSSSSLLPLATVNLNCQFINDEVKIAVKEGSFPLPGVSLILGNDLANQSRPNLIIYSKPLVDADEQSPLVTNSALVHEEREGKVMAVTTRSAIVKDSDKVLLPDLVSKIGMSKDSLIRLQKEDRTLGYAFNLANTKGLAKLPGFYIKDEVLFRKFRPVKGNIDDTWNHIDQLVVPLELRSDILDLAHNVTSHFGIRKTFQRIANDFFWPKMKADVVNHIKSCHICQVAGNPNETIPKAPLNPIIVPTEPFQRIIIDCVGPLPKTRKANQYILTILCPTTRYPIALPLRNITAKNILKQLTNVFTVYGFPKVVQSDRGTNFTSTLFQNTMKQLCINQIFSSPYHPESQGALERHHQTLKNLLKKFCLESESDWDEGLDQLLFLIREVPCESLGVSPFQMLFGRKVRGPLEVIKDKLLNSELEEITLGDYLKKLKSNMDKIHAFALTNLAKHQDDMKFRYDRKAKVRKFKVGDMVLAFIPIPGSPFKSKYSGPYKVSKVVNNNNYVLQTPERRKSTQLVHVNLLKAFHDKQRPFLLCSRDTNVNLGLDNVLGPSNCIKDNVPMYSASVSLPVTASEVPKVEEPEFELPSWKDCSNSEILDSLPQFLHHLDERQRSDIGDILTKYQEVCSDEPRECTVMSHDIQLVHDVKPIKQNFYRMSAEKTRALRDEVKYLVDHNLATVSRSPWASPCLLVTKSNGSNRLCTDFRKVNAQTIKDSYPLPRIDDILDSIGQAKFLTQLDLLKGYYQIPLTERAKEITAFITPFGLFQYQRLPFGLCNAPATFQRMINGIIAGMEGVYAYLDDILIVSDTWEDHIKKLWKLFAELEKFKLTINLAKSNFGKGKVEYLGHVIGSGEIYPKQRNLTAILDFPTPTTRKEVRRFLGMASYYRKFCKNLSEVAHPLINLTSPKKTFVWDADCEHSLGQIKKLLCSPPILTTPDPCKPFTLQVDACDTGVGAVLLQNDEATGTLKPISYFSHRLKPHHRSLSTVEKELLAIILSVKKFDVYFSGNKPVTIQTDHSPLTFLEKMKGTNQKLLRWALFLQEYNLIVQHLPGKLNVIADTLSRTPEPLPTSKSAPQQGGV